jgi:hypothetical protein
MESQIRGLLSEKDHNVSVHMDQLQSYKEENEKLKRQMFTLTKDQSTLENKLIDTEDKCIKYRKRY